MILSSSPTEEAFTWLYLQLFIYSLRLSFSIFLYVIVHNAALYSPRNDHTVLQRRYPYIHNVQCWRHIHEYRSDHNHILESKQKKKKR